MKIIFINPYCLDQRIQDYDIRVPPIGVYYLAAFLIEKGHQCEIYNWYNIKGKVQKIEAALKNASPDVICFSILHANRWGGIEIAELCKKIFPNTPIIFGGPGATFLWEHLLKNFPQIDFIVKGEGEISLSNLISALSSPSPNFKSIKGIAFRENNRPISTEHMPFIEELDTLPDPAKYFSFQHVISSRGCPWNCTFCGSPQIWKRRVRFHSPGYFVKQLKRLKEKGNHFFFISDDTFTLNKERVIEICKKIIKEKLDITWVAISRVNIVDEEILYWMRLAGCIQISYGVESGSYKIRKKLNKNITDDEIAKAFELTSAYGIMPRAYFIYGNPGESKETITQTINLINRIKPLSAIFYILDIFPGTKLYEDFKSRTKSNDDIWLKKIEDIMYFQTDNKLTEKKILNYGRRLRQAFFKKLPEFALTTKLVKISELSHLHADFLSRLAMTFAFGDYSNNPDIPNPTQTAHKLFLEALKYFPDHRAFLGLGMLYQRANMHKEAVEILTIALKHYPNSEELNICLGVSLMNMGKFDEALKKFLPFSEKAQAIKYALLCAKALNDQSLIRRLSNKLTSLNN